MVPFDERKFLILTKSDLSFLNVVVVFYPAREILSNAVVRRCSPPCPLKLPSVCGPPPCVLLVLDHLRLFCAFAVKQGPQSLRSILSPVTAGPSTDSSFMSPSK